MELGKTLGDLRADLGRLRRQAAHARRTIKPSDLVTGRWFWEVMAGYLVHHPARRRRRGLAAIPEADRARRATALVGKTGALTALGGLGAGAATTAASVVTAHTEGVAAPVAFPAAAAALGADMLLRTSAHLRMACDLGDLYGVELGPGSEAELVNLYALALGLGGENGEPERGVVDHLLAMRDAGHAGGVGARVLSETVLRNVVPYVGVLTSPAASFLLTRRIGRFVQRYAVRLAPLERARLRLEERAPEYRNLLTEGIWFVFIADGRLTATEAAILAHLLHARPEDVRWNILSRLSDDEEAWLERLRQVRGEEPRRLLVDALVAAIADGRLDAAEGRILHRAAEALETPVEPRTHRRSA